MNVYDSERISEGLRPLGYETTPSLEAADLIIANTCAIREKAQQKVFSFLGRVSRLKRERPGLIVGVGGCVAQQEGEKLLERVPHLDLVFGTHAVGRLPQMIGQIESKRCRMVDVDMCERIDEPLMPCENEACRPDSGKATGFVTIMQGCDNYCTFCVVPYVRGREMSRRPEDIIREIKALVRSGVREVTLLGQNVNSYGKKEGLCSFSDLLHRVDEIPELLRIRFTTSHPKDLSNDLMDAFRDVDKLCRHIHLPVQSGSDRILRRMNRKYSQKGYLEKVERLRAVCPDIAISSDMIAGFPRETRADFKETLDLMKTVEYDSLFAFKYSDRPNAAAARFPDKIPEDEKLERLQSLLELQAHYTAKKNRAMIGSTERVLVEGLSRKSESIGERHLTSDIWHQWTGRTSTNKIVNFVQGDDSNPILAGQIIPVRIDRALAHSLRGKPLRGEGREAMGNG